MVDRIGDLQTSFLPAFKFVNAHLPVHNLGYPITEWQPNLKFQRRRISVCANIDSASEQKKGSAGKNLLNLYATPNFRTRGITVGISTPTHVRRYGHFQGGLGEREPASGKPLLRHWSHLEGSSSVLENETSSAIVGNRVSEYIYKSTASS